MINVYEGDLLAQVEICLNSKYPVLNKAPSQVFSSIFLLTCSCFIQQNYFTLCCQQPKPRTVMYVQFKLSKTAQ